MSWLALLALAAVLTTAAPVASQTGPRQPTPDGVTIEQVVRHAALAPQIVDYEGTKILSVLRGAEMETVTLNEAHKRPARTRLDFLSPEGVAGRILIDDGLQAWHYEPRLHMVFVGPSLGPMTDAPLSFPIERYGARWLGTEEVIGRPTAVISLWPRAGGRERRLWIDRTTGVALRVEERDPADGLVLTAYFTRISFGLNLPPALFQPRPPAGARIVTQAEVTGPVLPLAVLERGVGFPVRVPQTLPGGFALLGGVPVRDGPVLAAHVQYSDGARVISLFVAPAGRFGPSGRGDAVAALGPGARTAVVGSMRLVLWDGPRTRLTLVGPLPLAELIALASAVGKAAP
ncbi:MAG: sigma-E factor regulatory protein RseB domain-containing protein [Armatimonadota bacterium]|nr:sigma-E factor regulatory protein RseB domain-containing protein [Armatimonadota bacterium]MDR7421680.1 sigma-E factor regulatory protein RseB domain-containing protein [Armatimonadota bacterium]MDR7454603.1 sigma-E factor regulatory protein RseB domain-containing protein [Armatimonadota bacterium]MDR7456535.1 sigma-E factor regulatory protein RseB domain-containing protein [Armatimonadota bacterium]MDR7495848.1 sigma-E factor regulatory protein RseB domain-containing protein [Armatimonadota